MLKSKIVLSTLSALLVSGFIATNSSNAQADRYEITPNIFTGGYDMRDTRGNTIWRARPNIFTGGMSIDKY